MSAKNLAEKLDALKKRRDSDRSALDVALSSLAQILAPAADHWICEHVEQAVRTNPDVAQSLGSEGLRKVKADLQALREQLPEMVQLEFSTPSAWPHHIPKVPTSKQNPGRESRDEGFPQAVFRRIVGNVGTLLDGYGLLKEPDGHHPSWSREGGRVRYAIGLSVAKNLQHAFADYHKGLSAVCALDDQIAEVTKQLEQAKAQELWEQA